MKHRIARQSLIALALLTTQLRAQEHATRSAAELLDLSIAYHDPNGVWGAKPLSFTLTGSRPMGPSSRTEIMTHAKGQRFRSQTVRNGKVIVIDISGDTVLTSIDGRTDLSDAERRENRLTPNRVQITKNYHEYLYGLPMKLRDPGTIIKPEAWRQEFQGKPVDAIEISYDPEVGRDTWQMFFDPKTHALDGYLFYHDLEKKDGEYITLEGEAIGPYGLRLPKVRSWYTNIGERHLGTDTIVEIGGG